MCCTGDEPFKRGLARILAILNAVKMYFTDRSSPFKHNFKCACITMRSLVMSPFSRDLKVETQVDYLRYLQCLNLHAYGIYTVPGF